MGTKSNPGLARVTENLYNSFSGDFSSDEYKDIVRKREFVTQKNKELDNKRAKERQLLRRAQEQADTNENIEKAKDTIKGGNQ